MKTVGRTIAKNLILSIIFIFFLSSFAAAATSRILVPFEDSTLELSPANAEEQKAIDELYIRRGDGPPVLQTE